MDSSSLHILDEIMPVQNVLLWDNDAISRSYYIYNAPKTWAFLESLLDDRTGRGGFLLRSHNVLGLNSPPNMVPLFTGKIVFIMVLSAAEQYPDDVQVICKVIGSECEEIKTWSTQNSC